MSETSEIRNRHEHSEHFDVQHENGEALMCMSSGGECKVLVEVTPGYSLEEERRLIASTTSALDAIDKLTDGKAADFLSGLHIKISEDVAEDGARVDAKENQVSLNGREMLLSVAEMRQVNGAYSEDELTGFPDEHRPGGALEYTLVHEIGRILNKHEDSQDQEVFAKGFAHVVLGMPVSEATEDMVRRIIDARAKDIAGAPTVREAIQQPAARVEGEEPSSGLPEDGERERHVQPFEVVLMRHGTPYRPDVIPDNPEDVARLGKLTEEGLKEARATAEQVVAQALSDGKPTTFFILGSPSPYYVEGQAFAARSMETAQVARETIEEAIRDKGLTADQADVHAFGSEVDVLGSKGIGVRAAKRLGEPDFYAVPRPDGTVDRRYADKVRALAKEEGSIEKYGGPGHLEPWLRSDPSLEGLRSEVGAQSAPEVANRVMKFIKVLERYAGAWQKEHPDRQMVVVMASHGEIMRTVIQHGFGAGEDAQGKVYDMAEAMPITIENGKATTVFNGKSYEVSL